MNRSTNQYIERGIQELQQPDYYWPSIDKYPWHSHQKRFPKAEDIGISLFSEFARRESKVRTLFETLHPLPLHGVNCLVWKTTRCGAPAPKPTDDSKGLTEEFKGEGTDGTTGAERRYRIIKVNENYYLMDAAIRNNVCYVIKRIEFKLRPFKAKVIADMYMDGATETGSNNVTTASLLRQNVSPLGSIRGEWRWSPPYKLRHPWSQNTPPLQALCVQDTHLYRSDFREYINKIQTSGDTMES
ncbi:uncharacterized protein BXIN_0594 [Babesia sp. Xinjiang]|uniref:uncharacterized protein n=1 Tax=Babesia sp. Xinjiang TaxID=462227 RepID=UPI000A2165E6|nr:uncharacterized protein BXIN_0594 [Babesia sp. Xinjiang]ORM41803.1 hypothetical protein BXIN_0594 [Babesia sp. Xinjiang]